MTHNSLTHNSKPIRPEQSLEGRVLKDDELDSVSGGSPFSMLQNAFSDVIKEYRGKSGGSRAEVLVPSIPIGRFTCGNRGADVRPPEGGG